MSGYEPVTRGETIAFVRAGEAQRIPLVIGDPRGFTGRLSGYLEGDGFKGEFQLLVSGGRVRLSLFSAEPVEPSRLARMIAEARDGFVEVEVLDEAKVSMELEYASEAGLEAVDEPLEDLMSVLSGALEAVEPQPAMHGDVEPAGATGAPASPEPVEPRREASEAPVDRLGVLLGLLEYNPRRVERLGKVYYSKYPEIVRLAEERAVDKRKLRPYSVDTLLNDLALRLGPDRYLVARIFYTREEVLLVARGRTLCLLLEKERGGSSYRVTGIERLARETPDEYRLYTLPAGVLDGVLGLCRPRGGGSGGRLGLPGLVGRFFK
ncbi:MAG: hypothetical protein GSR80_001459 [Desulfurococcales archaeon]|nr:hypothetical protein [Desulfurococcales archaeon]